MCECPTHCNGDNVVFLKQDVLAFWLKKGVDAFKLDHADYLFETRFLKDNEQIRNVSAANKVSSLKGDLKCSCCIPMSKCIHRYTSRMTEAYSLIRQTEIIVFVQCLNRRHRTLRISIFVPSKWFDSLLSNQCDISGFFFVFVFHY